MVNKQGGIVLLLPLAEPTFTQGQQTAAVGRYCSLIPGLGVKLSTHVLAGATVLSAVGACPPHDGARRRRRINVESAVALLGCTQKIGRSHQRQRPGRDVSCPLCAGTYDLLMHVMRRLYYSTS
jgi:hypothetical protein